jgi:hypothetical protein
MPRFGTMGFRYVLARLRRRFGLVTTTVVATMAVCMAGETASARVVQTIGTTGPQSLRYPDDVALGPSGTIYVLDESGRQPDPKVLIRVYSPAGRALRSWRVDAPDSSGVYDIAVDQSGNAYVSSSGDPEILKYSATGQLLTRWRVPGVGNSQLDYATKLAVDLEGNLLVAEGNGRIETFDGDGHLRSSWQYGAPGDSLSGILGVAVASSGMIYVADRQGIVLLDSSGTAVRRIVQAGGRLDQTAGGTTSLVPGPAGSLYVVREQRIQKFGPGGQFLGAVGSDRWIQWLSAAVEADGSIYVPEWFFGGRYIRRGAVLKLAPITAVDSSSPSIKIGSISRPPIKTRAGKRTRAALARLRFTLSESASFRINLNRRASTTDRDSRYFGRFLRRATLDEAVTSAGTHTLVLDWSSFPSLRARPGSYQLVLVARDDAGNESAPTRVRFSVARP